MAGEKTQITSAGSSIRTKPLGKNWTRGLKAWLNGLLGDLRASEVQAGLGTSVSQLGGGGRSVNAAQSGGQGAGNGDIGLPAYPGTDGTYVLGVVVSGDGASQALQWIGTETCT